MTMFLSLAHARKEAINLMLNTGVQYKVLGVHTIRALMLVEYILIRNFGLDPETTMFRKKVNYIYVRLSTLGYRVVVAEFDDQQYIAHCQAIIFDKAHKTLTTSTEED